MSEHRIEPMVKLPDLPRGGTAGDFCYYANTADDVGFDRYVTIHQRSCGHVTSRKVAEESRNAFWSGFFVNPDEAQRAAIKAAEILVAEVRVCRHCRDRIPL
jgi:hypothetical protein